MLGQDLREQPPQEIWGKSIPSRRNMKGRPGLEMRELRPASGRGGSGVGRAGLCIWAPVSRILGVVETTRAMRSAVSWVLCASTLSLGCCGAEGTQRGLKGGCAVMQRSAGTGVTAVTLSRGQGAGVHPVWAAQKMPFGDHSLVSGQNDWVAGCSLLRGRKLQAL